MSKRKNGTGKEKVEHHKIIDATIEKTTAMLHLSCGHNQRIELKPSEKVPKAIECLMCEKLGSIDG